jgi:hypothetical protein
MKRKICYIVNCAEYNYSPQEALQELKESLISEDIQFDGIFYECNSQKGYVWKNQKYTSPTVTPTIVA